MQRRRNCNKNSKELTPCSFHECSSSHFGTAVVDVAGVHCETGCYSLSDPGGEMLCAGGGNYVAVDGGDAKRTRGVEGGKLAAKKKNKSKN